MSIPVADQDRGLSLMLQDLRDKVNATPAVLAADVTAVIGHDHAELDAQITKAVASANGLLITVEASRGKNPDPKAATLQFLNEFAVAVVSNPIVAGSGIAAWDTMQAVAAYVHHKKYSTTIVRWECLDWAVEPDQETGMVVYGLQFRLSSALPL